MLLIVVSAVWLLATDLVLGAVAVAVFPLLIGAQRRLPAPRRPLLRRRPGRSSAQLSAGVHESFDGVQLVKAYGAEQRETERLSTIAGRLRDARVERRRGCAARSRRCSTCCPSLTNVGLVVRRRVSGCSSGEMTVGELTSFIYLFTLLVFPLRLIGYALSELPHSLAGWRPRPRGARRADRARSAAVDRRRAAPARASLLDDVTFAFAGDAAPALRRRRPATCRRAGSSPSSARPAPARRTLVELVAGLVAADDGAVAVAAGGRGDRVPGGVPVRRHDPRQRRARRRRRRRRAVGGAAPGARRRLRRRTAATASTRWSASAA